MHTLLDYIGKTSLLRLNALTGPNDATIWAKMENLNPAGSIKDRIALNIINDAEKNGVITPGETTIVEATSGNTGIALSMVCSVKGYKLKLFMPESASRERKEIIHAFGADIVDVNDPAEIKHAITLARKYVSESAEKTFFVGQFSNISNKTAHKNTTASEIMDQVPGSIDALVIGVGTGGTITGIGEVLRKQYENIKIYAVEPAESSVLSGGSAGTHTIEGIGVGFIPDALNVDVYDEVIKISSTDAKHFTNEIVRKEGILIGISSGATCLAAKKVAQDLGRGRNVVTVFFDTGERYLSTGLFS